MLSEQDQSATLRSHRRISNNLLSAVAPGGTRTQTGVVGLPKCSITLQMNFALSFKSQPQ
jgi:hypothetical protein